MAAQRPPWNGGHSGPIDPGRNAGSGDGWGDLLRGDSPRIILARIWDGDPLEVAPRCAARLSELGLLLPLDSVHLRALARIAHGAALKKRAGTLEVFLMRQIDTAIWDIEREERERDRTQLTTEDLDRPPYSRVAAVLGLERGLGRAACLAFNALPEEQRRICYPLLVEGRSLRSLVEEGRGAKVQIEQQFEQALTWIARAIGSQLAWPGDGDRRERG